MQAFNYLVIYKRYSDQNPTISEHYSEIMAFGLFNSHSDKKFRSLEYIYIYSLTNNRYQPVKGWHHEKRKKL